MVYTVALLPFETTKAISGFRFTGFLLALLGVY